jgi:hypothetical protein
MNFSNKVTEFAGAFLATVTLLISANACTEVNDELGGSLLPKNQQMTIRIDRLDGVRMFTEKQDTLRSNGLGEVLLGKRSDPIFGRRTNSFIVQFLPISLPYEGKGYGIDPIADSLVITMPLNSVEGNYDVEQKFNVYAIDWDNTSGVGPDSLSADSTYYTFFRAIDYYDPDKLLFTFTNEGKRGIETALVPTEAGKEYLNSIVNFDMDSYKDDKLFRNKYKGFYIAPANDSPTNAATYNVSLDYSSAFMTLYARNHDTLDVSAIYDTLYQFFSFSDQTPTTDIPFTNLSINMVDWDYTGTPIESALAQTESNTPQSVTYIQPMNGVITRLEFTDALVETLRDLRNQTDSKGNITTWPGIMINQAEMYLYLKDDSTPSFDASMKRVGSYLNPNTLASTPDYLYTYEYNYQQQSGGEDYMLPYNGYLDRSRGYYKMDITSYVQQLAKEVEQGAKPAISQTVYLAPDAYSFFKTGESVVQNGENEGKHIGIKITYTLID